MTPAGRCGRTVMLEFDKGVKVDYIARIAAARACTFVAGPAVFGAPDAVGRYRSNLAKLRGALARG